MRENIKGMIGKTFVGFTQNVKAEVILCLDPTKQSTSWGGKEDSPIANKGWLRRDACNGEEDRSVECAGAETKQDSTDGYHDSHLEECRLHCGDVQ